MDDQSKKDIRYYRASWAKEESDRNLKQKLEKTMTEEDWQELDSTLIKIKESVSHGNSSIAYSFKNLRVKEYIQDVLKYKVEYKSYPYSFYMIYWR